MKRPSLILWAIIGLTLLTALETHAETVPAAIGRISYGADLVPGSAICTGVLVSPDRVLTAAHCVRSAAAQPETIRFEVGWSGESPAERRGARVTLTDEGGSGLAGLGQDVALLILDKALPSHEFPPLPLAAPGSGPFVLIAFDRAEPDRPRRAVTCRPLAKPQGLLALDCPVVSGNSGAPLLQAARGGWQVVAVMAASTQEGPVRSWAVVPPSALRLQIPAYAEESSKP